jgi:thiamine kinase-like enzyme
LQNNSQTIPERALGFLKQFLGDSSYQCSPIGEGMTNTNFHIKSADREFVLRIAGAGTDALGIDRHKEVMTTDFANSIGLSPKVLASDLKEGLILIDFVKGDTLEPASFKSKSRIKKVARMLKELHQSPSISGEFNGLNVVHTYREKAVTEGFKLSENAARSVVLTKQIQSIVSKNSDLCPCHNDLLAANFIEQGQKIWLIDWEYAGMGDPYFDLANFAVNQDLSTEEIKFFLEQYNPKFKTKDFSRLMVMRVVSDLREAWWGYLQSRMSRLKFDFYEYGEKHAARALSTSITAEYKTWINALNKESK